VPDSFATVHWLRVVDQESAGALSERVKQLLNAAPGAAAGASHAVPATPRARKHVIGAAIVLAAAAAIGTGYYFVRSTHHTEEQVAKTGAPPSQATIARSLVVLPFVDMSEKRDQDYFADGLTEELIDRLTRSDDIRVIA